MGGAVCFATSCHFVLAKHQAGPSCRTLPIGRLTFTSLCVLPAIIQYPRVLPATVPHTCHRTRRWWPSIHPPTHLQYLSTYLPTYLPTYHHMHLSIYPSIYQPQGKTLVAVLPAYLNALAGKGVHVVTVNDYLARRDSEWVGQVHRFLGLKVRVCLGIM